MATSGSSNFTMSRDDIIATALRRINELGTGETAGTTRTTECALALNMIMKEWQADGMQLWKKSNIQLTPLVGGTRTYAIGTGQTISTVAPMRVIQAYYRNTASGVDTPIMVRTMEEYTTFASKAADAVPTQLFYNPPGATTGNLVGSITFFQDLDTAFVAANTVWIVGVLPLEDFDASTDNPDCPSYYYNALSWALAEVLSYESGAPLAERSMISKMAERAKEKAMSLDQEEGSLFFQPSYYG